MAKKAVVPDALWTELVFEVDGMPETKGSWRPTMRRGRMGMRPDNEAEPAWAAAVGWAARATLRGGAHPDRRRYAVQLEFTLPPVAGRGRSNRRDLDKLERSILDALTGILWLDDEQVTKIDSDKDPERPRSKPGVRIRIIPREVRAARAA